MNYAQSLTAAMTWLGEQPDTVFLGQSVAFPGNALYKTLSGVPMEKRLELPIAEEMQMGMSLGLALTGKTVISIYPRFDFLLLAMNQLVNHLDKIEEFTNGQFQARVLVRVGIGRRGPLYPGIQHCGDHSAALKKMLLRMNVIKLLFPDQIEPLYRYAYSAQRSTILIEDMNLYGD